MPTPEEDAQIAIDYLGSPAPLTIGGKATLPVGGPPAGASSGPAGPSGTGGAGVGNSVGGGGSVTGSVTGQGGGGAGALPFLQGGMKVVDVARKLGNIPGTPLRAPSSEILEGAPDHPLETGRGFSAPSPTFQGPDSGALSGAEASLAAGAEQGVTDLGGEGGLGGIGIGLNLAGQVPGAISTIGNPNLSAGEKASALGFQGLRAGLGFTGAGAAAIPLVEGVEGLVNKLAFGGGGYTRTREGEQRSLGDAMPDALDAILTADSPEAMAAALQGLGGPQVGVIFNDPANPLAGVHKFGGVHLPTEQVAPYTQALNDAIQYQQAILEGLKVGNPQAMALYDAAKQASMARQQQREAQQQEMAAMSERMAAASRADAP